jgi:pimeloyl-ACP methyl ester carboxylesterase
MEVEVMAQRIDVDTVVGRLKVTTHGEGRPALLWHSLFVDERSWDRVTAGLGADRQLVLVTGPGHGESTDPGRRYSLRECARAAVEVLDALGVATPVDWVGNAWGGHVGVLVATAEPDRVGSLVTIGSPVAALSTHERLRMRTLLVAHRALGPAGFILDGVVETMLAPATRARDPEAVALLRGSVAGADPRMLRNAVVSISLHRVDISALLADVAVPTLMITGEQHSGFTPPQAEEAASRLRDGRLAVVPDAAYLVPLEQPDRVVELVQEFWHSLESPQRQTGATSRL